MSAVVSTNIIAFPKLIHPTNLLANGLQYHYKLVQSLEQSNLYIEIISQVPKEPVEGEEVVPTIQTTYLSPADFDDELIRAAISKEILEFLLELNLIKENEFESAQQPAEDVLYDSDVPVSEEVVAANEAASAAEDATTAPVDTTPVSN